MACEVCPDSRPRRKRARNGHAHLPPDPPEPAPAVVRAGALPAGASVSGPPLVLASGSRFRRELLARLGIDFVWTDHRCDESEVMRSGRSPEEVTRHLAEAKARSVRSEHPGALILGSDQVVDLDGEVLGKPDGPEGAFAQLARLRGRAHRLVTAVALLHPGDEVEVAVDVHHMRLRHLSDAELRRYVARDQPTDCAGSYKVDALGIALFDSIEGRDFTAIVGLPTITVVTLLRRAGFTIP